MMLLHPSTLSALPALDEEEALELAKISPLMDPAVVKYLIGVLSTNKVEVASD
jgi:hypothetical protein